LGPELQFGFIQVKKNHAIREFMRLATCGILEFSEFGIP
jgi:hypothetical protein